VGHGQFQKKREQKPHFVINKWMENYTEQNEEFASKENVRRATK
jgi:hypothetical protein